MDASISRVNRSKEAARASYNRLSRWYADCRPIFARRALELNGFLVQDVSVSSMWGLPVEIVFGKTMKIIDTASGAANMYCGSCMHDNALAAGMTCGSAM